MKREDVTRALDVATTLQKYEPLDPVDRTWLSEFLMHEAEAALTPKRPANRPNKFAGRNFWIAVDYLLTSEASAQKIVANRWSVTAANVGTIVRRMRADAEVIVSRSDAGALRRVVEWHRSRHSTEVGAVPT